MADAIKAQQDRNDPQHYNDRYDSGKQAQDFSARVQHRKDSDLPPTPTLDPGGDPDVWRPQQIDYQQETEREQEDQKLQALDKSLIKQQKEANPGWDWD